MELNCHPANTRRSCCNVVCLLGIPNKIPFQVIWARAQYFLQDCMCTQWRLKSACTFRVWSESLQGTLWGVKNSKHLQVAYEDRSACTNVQADLRLHWAHMQSWGKCWALTHFWQEPASVAQSDSCLTGDQVTGSIPCRSSNILLYRLIMKYFLLSFSPFHWFKKGNCQFLEKECA